jgi:hypothetical protein
MGVVLGSYLVGLALTLVVNWARYGSPLNFGYAGEGWTAPLQLSLPAVLVSPGWGIIWEFPAILLAPLGVAYLFRREQGRIGVIMGGLIIAQLLNTAAWHDWAGGWNWGLRLFVPALPITTVLAIAGMEDSPTGCALGSPRCCSRPGLSGPLLASLPISSAGTPAWCRAPRSISSQITRQSGHGSSCIHGVTWTFSGSGQARVAATPLSFWASFSSSVRQF